MTTDITLDAIGLLCPLPILRLRKALLTAVSGQIICILSDDPVARIDIPHFCTEQGVDLIKAEDRDQGLAFWVRTP